MGPDWDLHTSYRMKKNIGYALISREAQIGQEVVIKRQTGDTAATLVELPFL